jgi:hypothetical protein
MMGWLYDNFTITIHFAWRLNIDADNDTGVFWQP